MELARSLGLVTSTRAVVISQQVRFVGRKAASGELVEPDLALIRLHVLDLPLLVLLVPLVEPPVAKVAGPVPASLALDRVRGAIDPLKPTCFNLMSHA